jgi:hypothetical protein
MTERKNPDDALSTHGHGIIAHKLCCLVISSRKLMLTELWRRTWSTRGGSHTPCENILVFHPISVDDMCPLLLKVY